MKFPRRTFPWLAISSLDDFVFGRAPHPVPAGRGLVFGSGTVVPEINFTLPAIGLDEANWPEARQQYREMIEGVGRRAVELSVPGLLVEFETLPPMTSRPEWGLEISRILSDSLRAFGDKHGLKSALRLTPNDNRDLARPVLMRSSEHWDKMVALFEGAASAGADLLAIESTGGKEISDEALMTGDLRALAFALGVLAPRDMNFLWGTIVSICERTGVIPSGDTACGFANTAMVLAEQNLIPRVLAAVVRVASVPRSLAACECGAVGPSKDCAYEGPYLKAIAGIPISMEGRTSACAHLSPVGNVAQAVCDCWSNESVQNVRLLSAPAPVVSLEQLAYDCRLMNTASRVGEDSLHLRDWLADSDSSLDPQAHVLRPDVVLRLAAQIVAEPAPYARTRRAILAALEELRSAQHRGALHLPPREARWLDNLQAQADALPESEDKLIAEYLAANLNENFLPREYGL